MEFPDFEGVALVVLVFSRGVSRGKVLPCPEFPRVSSSFLEKVDYYVHSLNLPFGI